LQTGEYRGFVGQFSIWLHGQFIVWRGPLLASLCLHVIFFWPKPLQENGSGLPVALAPSIVQARLKPALPIPSQIQVKSEVPQRHAVVTQSASGSRHTSPVVPSDEVIPVEPTRLVMQAQATAGLDAGAVRAYRIAWARALMGSALRERLDADMQGALEVGVAVAASGQVREIFLLKGSGVSALDAAVIAAMHHAAQTVQLPPQMQGREFVLGVPVEVGLVPSTSAVGR
jgi:TonB family protein